MARKVNTKFLLILLLVIGTVVAAGGGFYYLKKRKDPKRFLAIAETAEQANEYAVAGAHYQGAAQMLKDPKLMVKAGDMYYRITYEDDANLGRAQQCWELAIATDPGHLPALERQLANWQEWLRVQRDKPQPRTYENVRDVAKKILALDPKHLAARAAIPSSIVDSWVHRISAQQTDVDKAVKDLIDLQKEDPTNADITFFIAAAYATQGDRAIREGKIAEGEKLNGDARRVIEEALKGNETNAKMYYRAAQIYLSESMANTKDEEKLKAKKERVKAAAAKAAELVKPEEPEYDDIKILAATLVSQPDLPKEPKPTTQQVVKAVQDAMSATEKIYTDMLKERPGDLAARLKLAELLGAIPARRDEAIELLKELPQPTLDQRSGPRGLLIKDMEAQAKSNLTNMRLDKLFTLKTKAEQDALLAQIETDYRILEAKAPDNPFVLRLKAKIQIAKGQTTEAISTLGQALAKADRDQIKYELMYLSAKCYLATNQTGTAKGYLQQIVSQFPEYHQARILLAQSQLKEFDFKSAETNLLYLREKMPDNIEVIRMHIAVLQHDKKTEEARRLYERLAEQTRSQKMEKATIAMLMSQDDEALRLLDEVAAADPGDIEAALMLSGFHGRKKETEKSLAALDRALKVKPDSSDLLLERARVTGGSAADLKQIRLKEAEKMTDPLDRALAQFELTRDEEDENIPLRHLQEAEKINAKDSRVLTAMFEYHLLHRNWDLSADYASKLGEINADKVKGLLFRWRLAASQAAAETDPKKREALVNKVLELAQTLTHDYPEFAQSWLCLGQSMSAAGRYEDAIPHYTSAMEKQPQNPEAYRGLIECYYQLKRPKNAGEIINKAVETVRTVPQFKEMQLQHEMNYGSPEKVIADREAAVKSTPDSPNALMTLAQAYANVARVKSSSPETEKEAKVWLEKALASLSQGAEKFPAEIQFTVVHGAIAQMLNKPDQGEKLWLTTLSRDPWKNNPAAVAAFADFYVRAKRPGDAEKSLRDYLTLPEATAKSEITLKLADLLASQNKIADAMTVVDGMPDDPRLQTRKIDLLISTGKMTEAEQILNTMLAKKKTPELTTSLAYVYLNSKRAPEAVNLLNEVLKENPGLTTARYFRAMATLRTGAKAADAIADLTEVRDATPDNLNARYLLAECYQRNATPDDAVRELEGILRVSPAQKAARMTLMEMYASTSPPRWLDGERISREGETIAELAGDGEFLAAQARFFSKRGDADRAVRYITQAMKVIPDNASLLRSYYGILVQGKMYQQLLTESDKLPAEKKDQSWVRSFRGTAKCKLGEKDAGLQEFISALNLAFTAKDETAGQMIIEAMADAASPEAALKVVSSLPQASETRWMLSMAWLEWKKGDLATSRKTLDKVLADMEKLTAPQQQSALGFAGSVFMQSPDPDFARAKDIFQQLVKLKPEDYRVWNNLACNPSVTSAEALEFGRKAFDLMTAQQTYDPMVADTYGWSLVQSGNEGDLDQGLIVLSEAWKTKQIPDIAYHLGEAYYRKNNAVEAEKFLIRAQELFNAAVSNKEVLDITLQEKIQATQVQVTKLKGKRS